MLLIISIYLYQQTLLKIDMKTGITLRAQEIANTKINEGKQNVIQLENQINGHR
jgi:hypothetical protein